MDIIKAFESEEPETFYVLNSFTSRTKLPEITCFTDNSISIPLIPFVEFIRNNHTVFQVISFADFDLCRIKRSIILNIPSIVAERVPPPLIRIPKEFIFVPKINFENLFKSYSRVYVCEFIYRGYFLELAN